MKDIYSIKHDKSPDVLDPGLKKLLDSFRNKKTISMIYGSI